MPDYAYPRVHNLRLGLGQAYLLEFPTGMVLVDSGSPGQERKVMKAIQGLGRSDLKLIFITHAHLDHYGSAAALQRITGAPVVIHSADAADMAAARTEIGTAHRYGKFIRAVMPWLELLTKPEPVQADILLEDGDDLDFAGVDARVLHVPGHTTGSSCLIVQDRLAFAGDLVLTTGRPHIQKFFAVDWSLIPASVMRLNSLHPQTVYPGHGVYPLDGLELQKLEAGLKDG